MIASDLDEAGLAGLKEMGVAECVKLDARDTAAIEAQAKRLGPVDVLFNAAGFVHHGSVLDCSEQDWDFAFDLNVKSMHRTIRAFLPGMLAKGKGSIVNIASTVGANKSAPNRYVYGATKAAVVGLTKAVATDFIAKGIRCNCICPGTIQTPSLDQRIKALGAQLGGEAKAREMFIACQPMGRLGTPEEMAHIAVFLASDEFDVHDRLRHLLRRRLYAVTKPGLLQSAGLALRRAEAADLVACCSATGGLCENRPVLGVEAAALLADYAVVMRDMEVWVSEKDGRLVGALTESRAPMICLYGASLPIPRRSDQASVDHCWLPPKSGRVSLVATSSGSIPARRSATSSPGTVGTVSQSSASRPRATARSRT